MRDTKLLVFTTLLSDRTHDESFRSKGIEMVKIGSIAIFNKTVHFCRENVQFCILA